MNINNHIDSQYTFSLHNTFKEKTTEKTINTNFSTAAKQKRGVT